MVDTASGAAKRGAEAEGGAAVALAGLPQRVLDAMPLGACVVDGAQRIVLANRRFHEIFGVPRDEVPVGMWMEDAIAIAAAHANYPIETGLTQWRQRVAHQARGESFDVRLQLARGISVAVRHEPLGDGLWIIFYEDITERERMDGELRDQVARFDGAISNMSHGLSMFGPDERLIVCNAQYIDMYGLDPAVARPGIPHRDLLAHWLSLGHQPGSSLDLLDGQRREARRADGPSIQHLTRRDGRVIEATSRPMPDGGWVTAHEDITDRLAAERALRERNALLDAALTNMGHGLTMFGPDERLIVCNDRYVAMYGLDPARLSPGTSYRDVIAHTMERGCSASLSLDELYATRMAAIRAGDSAVMRYEMADGRTFEATARPTPDGGWVTAHEDITDRLAADRALREQNLLLDAALENMAHGLCVFDAELRLVAHNARVLDMYGLTAEEMRPGTPQLELIRRSVARGVIAVGVTAEQVFEDYRRRLIDGHQEVLERRLASGRVVAVRHRPMANGGWVATYEDVTEREHAVSALSAQNALFDTALENMAQGLCMYDADNRLIVRNDRYVAMFNADPDVVAPGATLREVFEHGKTRGMYPDHTVDELVDRRMAIVAKGGVVDYDQKMADGRTLKVSVSPRPGGGWVGTFEDVTEPRRVETERATAVAELHERTVLLDATLDNMAHGLCVFDAELRMVMTNRRYLEIYALTPADVAPGTPLFEVIRTSVSRGVHVAGFSAEEVYETFKRRLIDDKAPVLYRKLADGRTIAVRHQPMANGAWVGTYEDVSERERAAEELREQHRRFDAALSNMSHGLCMLDADMRMIVCNSRYLEMYGLSPDVVKPGVTMREIMRHSVELGNHPEADAEILYRGYLAQLAAGETVIERPLADGRTILITHRPMDNGSWVALYEDITERRRVEARISHMARHDALTGLPNRLLFREKMAEGLTRVAAHRERLALLCLDLDNFKAVNDTLGHPIGDRLLEAVASRLVAAVRAGDTVARLGGDEFAILQYVDDPGEAETLAQRLIGVFSDPVTIEGHEINPGVSIGIALAPHNGTAADQLMKCADLALYQAKAQGRGTYRFFEPDMDLRIQTRRALEVDLRRALGNAEFHLVYQPQVRATTGELTGFEALLRWRHPERGVVSPVEFIPLAEETGLIVPLGEWVLREACAEAARWPRPVKVAVNLSPVQFRSRGLIPMVTNVLAATGLSPRRLELEITEAVLLQDDDATVALLHQLRALGIRISMDDFGIGYSSLSYLRSFPFDKIKIDRSFVADLERSADNAAIIRAIAGLGNTLGIETTAEGVETEAQLEFVRRGGCTEVQGYLISRPLPVADLPGFMAEPRGDVVAA